MKTIAESNDCRGRKMSDDSQEIKDGLDDFYDNHYRKLIVEKSKLSYTNLNQSLEYEAVSILTCMSNHIQEQFESMVNRYINILVNREELKKTVPSKILMSQLYRLKRDILLGESKADAKFDPLKKIFNDRILQGFIAYKIIGIYGKF
jgi:hypothetical protein